MIKIGQKILKNILTLIAVAGYFFLFSVNKIALAISPTPTNNIFGQIKPPPGVDQYQTQVGEGEIGLILFLSRIIELVTIAAGIWVMINFVLAGWIYITSSGDASAGEKVSTKLTNSVIGLAIIALSYTLAGLVGFLIFGDPGFILNPSLRTILDFQQ